MFIGKTGHINVCKIYWSTPTPASHIMGWRYTDNYIYRGAAHKNVGRKFWLQSAKLEPTTL